MDCHRDEAIERDGCMQRPRCRWAQNSNHLHQACCVRLQETQTQCSYVHQEHTIKNVCARSASRSRGICPDASELMQSNACKSESSRRILR